MTTKMPKCYLDMESPDDLIHKYATPSASSSPASYDLPFHELSPPQETFTAADVLPSSSLPSKKPSAQHRRTLSITSGYVRRAQLHDRGSHSSSSGSTPSSRGLERIAERRRRDLPTPESESAPRAYRSALGKVAGASIEQYARHGLKGPHLEPHQRASHGPKFLRAPYPGGLSTHNFRSRSNQQYTMREEIDDSEAVETSLFGDGLGPGPMVNSRPYFRVREQQGDIPTLPPADSQRNTRCGYEGSSLLRQNLVKAERHARDNVPRTASWTNELFGRHRPTVSRRSSFKTRFSDDNISELSFVEPRNASMLPQVEENVPRGLISARRDHNQDSKFDPQSYNQPKGIAAISASRSWTTDMDGTVVHESNRTRKSKPPITQVLSPGDAFILDLGDESRVGTTTPEENAMTKDIPRAISHGSALSRPFGPGIGTPQTPVPFSEFLELSNNMATYGRNPKFLHNHTPSSKQPSVVVEGPKHAQQQLTISNITEIMSEEHVSPQASRGLSFAAANAIVYGCTTFAALRFAFVYIGEEMQSIDLATDMAIATSVGLIACLLVYLFRMMSSDIQR